MATALEVAQWMLDEYKRLNNNLEQQDAADKITGLFGPEHTYENRNGGTGINKSVLDEFRKLTPTGVVWSRSELCWRSRSYGDPEGKRMVP